jgi:ABC-2 type transport system permease protein
VVVPPERLGGLAPVARLLPSGALGDALRAGLLHGTVRWSALGVLGAWAVAAGAAAARWFRWD